MDTVIAQSPPFGRLPAALGGPLSPRLRRWPVHGPVHGRHGAHLECQKCGSTGGLGQAAPQGWETRVVYRRAH